LEIIVSIKPQWHLIIISAQWTSASIFLIPIQIGVCEKCKNVSAELLSADNEVAAL
jgi:hypothetical protein